MKPITRKEVRENKEAFDDELLAFWTRWDGARGIPFLGDIRRYLHRTNNEKLADTSQLWKE